MANFSDMHWLSCWPTFQVFMPNQNAAANVCTELSLTRTEFKKVDNKSGKAKHNGIKAPIDNALQNHLTRINGETPETNAKKFFLKSLMTTKIVE